jgi:CRISPR system Cascade subunit CasB
MTAGQLTVSSPGTGQPGWVGKLARALTTIYERPEAAARCRRGLGKPPMEVPEMWEYCVPVVMTLPEDSPWRRRIEQATHHVLTLYAVHQQSQRDSMHKTATPGEHADAAERRSVGAACRRLYEETSSEGVRRRFLAAATAQSVPELAGHLRCLVTLLRGEKIPLDYLALAWDIADWPDPRRRARVRRRWGLDFYRVTTSQAGRAQPGDDQKEPIS